MNTKRIASFIVVALLLAALPGMTAVLAQGQDPAVPGVIMQGDPETGLPVPVPNGSKDAPVVTQVGEAYSTAAMPPFRLDEVEPNNTRAQANFKCDAYSFNCVLGGKIGTAGDVDWWRFRIDWTSGRQGMYAVLFDIEAEAIGSPVDTVICLYADDMDVPIDCNDDMGDTAKYHDSMLFFNFEANRDYYLTVTDYWGHGGSNYRYQLIASTPLLVSTAVGGNVAGIPFQAGDVLAWSANVSKWVMLFDISDLNVSANVSNLSAGWRNSDYLLLGFPANVQLPGISRTITPYDVVVFNPTRVGPRTEGTFQGWWTGSAQGLTTTKEKIDAIDWPDWNGTTRLYVSTVGPASVKGGGNTTVSLADEDVGVWRINDGLWGLDFDGSWWPGLAAEDVIAITRGNYIPFEYPVHGYRNMWLVIAGTGTLDGTPVTQKDIVNARYWEVGDGDQWVIYGAWNGPSHGLNFNLDAIHFPATATAYLP